MDYSGVFRGDGATAPPFGLTMNFVDNFCTVFVSFISRLSRKIRVPQRRRLNATCFLPVKNRGGVKINMSDLLFWGRNDFFLASGEVAQPPPPHLTPLGAPLLD